MRWADTSPTHSLVRHVKHLLKVIYDYIDLSSRRQAYSQEHAWSIIAGKLQVEYLQCNSKDVFECKLYWPFVVMTDVHMYNSDLFSAADAQNLPPQFFTHLINLRCRLLFLIKHNRPTMLFAALTALYFSMLLSRNFLPKCLSSTLFSSPEAARSLTQIENLADVSGSQ